MLLSEIILDGERVKLLPLEEAHLTELFSAAQFKEIWAFSSKQVSNIEDMKELLEEALSRKGIGTEYPFVIYDKYLKKIVGSTRYLNMSGKHRNLEIGWTWLTPSVWRTRVNTESKYLLLKYAFENLQSVRVQFKADIRNERSNRAIERIGAIREGQLRRD